MKLSDLTPTELALFDTMPLHEQAICLNFWEAVELAEYRNDERERERLQGCLDVVRAEKEKRDRERALQ